MSRKQRRLPQQTFEVSQKDLEGYYSKYLPGFAPGGAYKEQPYKSSAMHTTTGGRLAGFMNRVAGGVKDAVTPNPTRPSVNKRDYQRTTITNNTNQDQYYDFDDGSVETKNVAMAEGINGALGMDNYLSGLQEVVDKDGNPVFSESSWNRDTGGVDYTNTDPAARTTQDLANERLSAAGAQYMNFDNEGNVTSYNNGTENVTYDPYAPIAPVGTNNTTTTIGEAHVPTAPVTTTTTTQGTSNQAQADEAYQNTLETNRYGGGLRRFQGHIGTSEYDDAGNELDAFGNPNAAVTPNLLSRLGRYDPEDWNEGRGATGDALGWAAQSSANADRDTEDMRDGPSLGQQINSDFEYTELGNGLPSVPETPTPVSTTGNTGSGMFQVNQDLGLPAPPVAPAAAPDMLEPLPPSLIPREEMDKSLVAPGPGIPVPQGTVEQEASWGDTTGQKLGNMGRYAGDKVLDSKLVRGFSEVADMAVEGAGIFNDWFGDRQAEAKEIQGISGTTTDEMATARSADADGLYGQFDQNSGLLRPNDGIISRSGKHGLEMYQDKGEVSQQQEYDAALLRQFMQMSEPPFQFSQNNIDEQKTSLGQMKHGGQVLDIDEELIQELIAAGANIEIL
jgi:hypothetical protein